MGQARRHVRRLAAVYGTTFPLPDGATVRRINDAETAAAAGAVASAANDIQKQIDKDDTIAKADKDSAKRVSKDLSSAANALKSRIKDGKLATGEARQVLDLASKLEAFTRATRCRPRRQRPAACGPQPARCSNRS